MPNVWLTQFEHKAPSDQTPAPLPLADEPAISTTKQAFTTSTRVALGSRCAYCIFETDGDATFRFGDETVVAGANDTPVRAGVEKFRRCDRVSHVAFYDGVS